MNTAIFKTSKTCAYALSIFLLVLDVRLSRIHKNLEFDVTDGTLIQHSLVSLSLSSSTPL